MMQAAAGTVGITRDPYFKNTVLLLKAPGANTTQNNTFIDGSSNAFTVTRNGNTTQGSFSPFSSTGWSIALGTSNYIKTVSGALMAYTTANKNTDTFTLEAFVLLNSWPAAPQPYSHTCVIRKGLTYMNFGIDASGYVKLYHNDGTQRTLVGTTVVAKGIWTHIAATVTGGTITLYVNGVACGTGTWYGLAVTNEESAIGWSGYDNYIDGYVSNVRVSNIARTITVPTANLVNDANTVWLMGGTNRFVDLSSNAYTFTVYGTTSIQPFSPFAPTAAYSSATHGASAYFDGSGDYLSIANNAAISNFSTGNFTLEAWVYPTVANTMDVFTCYTTWASAVAYYFQVRSGGDLKLVAANAAVNFNSLGTPPYVLPNAWSHIAAVRNGTGYALYVNGVSVATATDSSSVSDAGPVRIGSFEGSSEMWTGYITDARIVKGTAVYTTNFTPPTAPLTAITNTQLLLNMKNAGITDVSTKSDLETFGNAQSSSTQHKFAATSMYFDGTGDYLKTLASPLYNNLSTGDFTIECWCYPVAFATYTSLFATNGATNAASNFECLVNSSGTITVNGFTSSTAINISSSSNLSTSQWQHVAWVRQGSVFNLFINGVIVGTNSNAGAINSNAINLAVGNDVNPGTRYWNGYIEDFRITKGVARYGGFTVPSATFAMLGETYAKYTTLLLKAVGANASQNNTFIDGSTNAFTITRNGNTTQGSFSPFSPTGWSVNFPGTWSSTESPTFKHSTPDNAGYALAANDFTIECWVFPNSQPGAGKYGTICAQRVSSVSDVSIYFGLAGTEKYYVEYSTNGTTGVFPDFSGGTLPAAGVWSHLALCRSGTSLRVFMNGTQQGSTYNIGAASIYNSGSLFYLGLAGTAWGFNGQISNFRLVNGTALYTTTFTPPTSALTAVTGTVLLACQSNSFSDNSQSASSVCLLMHMDGANGSTSFVDTKGHSFSTYTGSPTLSTTQKKFGASSFYSAGTAGIVGPTTTDFDFGTEDFTIEAWIYPTNVTQTSSGFISNGDANGNFSFEFSTDATTANKLRFRGSNGSVIQYSTTMLSANAWQHVAYSRVSGTGYLFLGGVLQASGADAYNYVVASSKLYIGKIIGQNIMPAYIDEIRLTKGKGWYTATFSLSTSAFGTSPTTSGTTSVQPFSPFNTTAEYSAATHGASAYFDGTGDYLTTPDSTGYDFTGDFTVETWVYTAAGAGIAGRMANSAGGWEFNIGAYGTMIPAFQTWFAWLLHGTAIIANEWTHIAISRSGTTLSMFQNGVRTSTATDSTNLSDTPSITMRIGCKGDLTGPLTGYLSNFRIVKGTAVYDPTQSTCTIPTAPLTAITNTQLLLSATNAGIVDVSTENDVETVGNAQVSTGTVKFSKSIYFDGSSSNLLIPYIAGRTDLFSGDFTVEMWVYPTAGNKDIWYQSTSFGMDISSTPVFNFYIDNVSPRITSSTVSLNAWYHLAISRVSGVVTAYVNGVSQGTYSYAGVCGGTSNINIGGPTPFFVGYIEDIRFTRGIGRYTVNFTPPTSALPSQ